MPDRFTNENLPATEHSEGIPQPKLTSAELRHLAINNGYKTWQPSIQATSIRSSELTHRTLGQGPSTRIAEQYLLASRMVRGDIRVQMSTRPYFNDDGLRTVSLIGHEEVHPDDLIPLPEPGDTTTSLSETIKSRRSRRDFSAEAISLEELTDIIGHSTYETGQARVDLVDGRHVSMPLYASANGGGLRVLFTVITSRVGRVLVS